MDLILWRHAEAEVARDGQDDLSRELTPKGERQALKMGLWLDRHLPDGTRVLASPARRTDQTAHALGRRYKLREELLPHAQVEDVLGLIKWDAQSGPTTKGSLLVVGHQPYLGQLVSRLLGMKEPETAFRKGAVWWLRTRQREGRCQTVLMTVVCPELTSRSWDVPS